MKRDTIHLPTSVGDRIADSATSFFGTWLCLGLHTLWFVLWFALRLDVSLLTNVVSLEAIYLGILIMMSQGRQAEKDEKRDDLEAQEVADTLNIIQAIKEINLQQSEILNLLKQGQ